MTTMESYEPGRPCWVDLATADPAAARAFYASLLGWNPEPDPRPEARGYTQFLKNGRQVAGCGPLPREGMPTTWTMYLATDDADKTCAMVSEHGGTVLMEPMDVFDAGRLAVFSAPDGSVAGLWQAREHVGATLVNEAGTWTWSHLATRDKAAAERFYADVFEWRTRRDADWGEYSALGDKEIASIGQIGDESAPEVPAQWQNTFMVADADATVARATELGGSSLGEVTTGGHGSRTGLLADPQGAQFAVISLPDR